MSTGEYFQGFLSTNGLTVFSFLSEMFGRRPILLLSLDNDAASLLKIHQVIKYISPIKVVYISTMAPESENDAYLSWYTSPLPSDFSDTRWDNLCAYLRSQFYEMRYGAKHPSFSQIINPNSPLPEQNQDGSWELPTPVTVVNDTLVPQTIDYDLRVALPPYSLCEVECSPSFPDTFGLIGRTSFRNGDPVIIRFINFGASPATLPADSLRLNVYTSVA
jgi:hypothetical protein